MSDMKLLPPRTPMLAGQPVSGVSIAGYWTELESRFAAWQRDESPDWSPDLEYQRAVRAGFVTPDFEGYRTWHAWREVHGGDPAWVGHERAYGWRGAQSVAVLIARRVAGDETVDEGMDVRWIAGERSDAARGFRAEGFDVEAVVAAFDAAIAEAIANARADLTPEGRQAASLSPGGTKAAAVLAAVQAGDAEYLGKLLGF